MKSRLQWTKACSTPRICRPGQLRKGSQIPYLVHPLGTACILIEHEAPSAVVIAAVLTTP